MSERIFNEIHKLLSSQNAEFRVMDHEPVRTSQEAADVRGTKLGQGAKALVCTIKGVNLERISALKAQSKAKIDEISKIGCEPLSEEIKRTSYLKDGKLYVVALLPSDMKADLEARF